MSEQNKPDVAALLSGLVNDYKNTHPELAAKERAQARMAASEAVSRGEMPAVGGMGAGMPMGGGMAGQAPMLGGTAQLHPLLEKMAAECEKRLASDIFISAGFPPSFKINGELIPVPLKPLSSSDTQMLVYSTMAPDQRIKFDKELELNYSVMSSAGVRFRVNAYHEQGRVGMVWRRITTKIFDGGRFAITTRFERIGNAATRLADFGRCNGFG